MGQQESDAAAAIMAVDLSGGCGELGRAKAGQKAVPDELRRAATAPLHPPRLPDLGLDSISLCVSDPRPDHAATLMLRFLRRYWQMQSPVHTELVEAVSFFGRKKEQRFDKLRANGGGHEQDVTF